MQRVVPYKTSHIPQVASIHCNQIIIGIIILPCHLTRRFAYTGNGMVCQLFAERVDRPGCPLLPHWSQCGGDFKVFLQYRLFSTRSFITNSAMGLRQIFPQTDEQDSGHFLSAPLGNSIPLSGQYWDGLFPALPERNEKHTLHQLCKDIRPARRNASFFRRLETVLPTTF